MTLAVAGDLSNLGNILRSMGDHRARARACLEEALAMPVVASDPIKRAYMLHNIANVHRAQGDLARALELPAARPTTPRARTCCRSSARSI